MFSTHNARHNEIKEARHGKKSAWQEGVLHEYCGPARWAEVGGGVVDWGKSISADTTVPSASGAEQRGDLREGPSLVDAREDPMVAIQR